MKIAIIVLSVALWGSLLFIASVAQSIESSNGGCHWYHIKKFYSYIDTIDKVVCADSYTDLTSCILETVKQTSCSASGAYGTTPTCTSCITLFVILGVTAVAGIGFLIWQSKKSKGENSTYSNLE
jgi:hypothetical protein